MTKLLKNTTGWLKGCIREEGLSVVVSIVAFSPAILLACVVIGPVYLVCRIGHRIEHWAHDGGCPDTVKCDWHRPVDMADDRL